MIRDRYRVHIHLGEMESTVRSTKCNYFLGHGVVTQCLAIHIKVVESIPTQGNNLVLLRCVDNTIKLHRSSLSVLNIERKVGVEVITNICVSNTKDKGPKSRNRTHNHCVDCQILYHNGNLIFFKLQIK